MAFGWVHRAAAILRNKKGLDAAGVRRRYRGLIAAIARHRRAAGGLAEAFAHFLKVTRSYWPGLFRCYDVAGPAADEQRPGAVLRLVPLPRAAVPAGGRWPARGRWCAGRCGWSASAATRLRPIEVADLVPSDLEAWRDLRGSLERRQAVRTLGRRFRRDPVAYLHRLKNP